MIIIILIFIYLLMVLMEYLTDVSLHYICPPRHLEDIPWIVVHYFEERGGGYLTKKYSKNSKIIYPEWDGVSIPKKTFLGPDFIRIGGVGCGGRYYMTKKDLKNHSQNNIQQT